MATELDHNTIKLKIVAILQADATLFTTTAEDGELQSIEVGFPQGNALSDKMPPYSFITNSNSATFETITRTGSTVSNAAKSLEHIFHYDIVVVVNEPDSRTAEVDLDNYQKLILQNLEADNNLTGVGSADVDDSWPVRVDHLSVPNADQGKGFRGRVITLRCIKTTS